VIQLLGKPGHANLEQLEQLLQLVLPPLLCAPFSLELRPKPPLDQEGAHDAENERHGEGDHVSHLQNRRATCPRASGAGRIIARNGSRFLAIHSDDRTLAADDDADRFTRTRAAAAVSFGD
jgi:hypothetical protein